MSSKNYQKKKYSSDRDLTKRKVDFNDYILLKDSFIELGEKYKKLKEDNKNMTKTIKEYKTQISEFQKTKNSITDLFKQIKEKMNKPNNKTEINETKKLLELEKEINIKNGEIIKLKEINLDFENKIKKLEEENNNKDKVIESLNIKEKKFEEDIKQKENENLLIIQKLNELKEEYETEKEKEKEKEKDIFNNNNIKKLIFDNLIIEENININIINAKNYIEEKNNTLTEEKNILITNSKKSDTNSSTNRNKIDIIIKNNNTNNSSNNINEIILNNYLNTINVGYNGLGENNDLEEKDENLISAEQALECEPIPSFICCIKKMSNN